MYRALPALLALLLTISSFLAACGRPPADAPQQAPSVATAVINAEPASSAPDISGGWKGAITVLR